MGSSLSNAAWMTIAVVCGLLFLIFDASRYFTHKISQVTLRRWSGDSDQEARSRWFHYDPLNQRLLNGAMLQIALVVALLATVQATESIGLSAAVWVLIVLVWKFALGFIPDDLGEAILHKLVPVSHFFYYLFWPILFPLRRVAERLDREEKEEEEQEEVTEEEVQAFIDVGEDEGILEASEGKMIHSVVEFGDRVARELMTPRIDVLAFDASRPLDELARLFSDSKYSRIPIYQGTIDRITGIVHIKDVFDPIFKRENKSVSELARPPYFVSETKKVSELLSEFQSEHLQVAVVVDEYGGTAGIITIEDVIEEIVGEIADEHEEDEATMVDLGNNEYLVSGQLRIDALDEMLDAQFSDEDYETVAGLIFTTLGRVPKAGATIKKNGYLFTVDRADRRRIYRVRVARDPEWNAEDATVE
ncbi:MAG: hemolysin family protein [Acidobacteriota bacterium]